MTRPTSALPSGLLTYDEAARALGLSVRTIKGLRKQRRIGHYRYGRRVYFSPQHIQDYLDFHLHEHPVVRRRTA